MCHWAALGIDEGGAGGANGRDHGGGHILAVNDVYGGTARMLSRTVRPLGVETTFLNFEQAGEEGIRKALRPDTRVRILADCTDK
jgi:cystathionine gamma-lyase